MEKTIKIFDIFEDNTFLEDKENAKVLNNIIKRNLLRGYTVILDFENMEAIPRSFLREIISNIDRKLVRRKIKLAKYTSKLIRTLFFDLINQSIQKEVHV